MNFLCRDVRVPWCAQTPRSKLATDAINVVCHDGDYRSGSTIEIAEEYLVAFPGENAERGTVCRGVISFHVLEVEDLRVELESLSEPPAPDLRNDGHIQLT